MDDRPNTRYVTVRGRGRIESLTALLPDNYRVLSATTDAAGRVVATIEGVDRAGWTLDDYVLPRLASGLWIGTETLPGPARMRAMGDTSTCSPDYAYPGRYQR